MLSRHGLTLVVLIGVTFGIGFGIGQHNSPHGDSAYAATGGPADVDLVPLWKAWYLLDNKFVPTASSSVALPEDRVWGLIDGLARSYSDPYTVFLPPAENEMFEEDISGTFGGVGIEIGVRDDILTVIAPLKNTPAQRAGILAGDQIIAISGKSTLDMTTDEAVRNIRGELGTEVVLTIARTGERELFDIPVVRSTIQIPTLDVESRSDGIYIISLYNFGGTATQAFRDALRGFVTSGKDKLIIDLRGNPGGYLEAAVDMASWFLPIGTVIVQEDFGTNEQKGYHRSKGYNVYKPNWQVVVLVNYGSASASEILAGALSEHNIATLIGTQTFGKGSVQELVDVTDDTSLKITIAQWLTPKGRSISDGGLAPDIEVEVTADDLEAGREPQLDAAVEYLLTGKVTAQASSSATSTEPTE